MRELTRTITRRLGNLVVTITPEGITLRGYRRRSAKRRKRVTWQQIATLADASDLFAAAENQDGMAALDKLGVTTLTVDRSNPS